MRQDQTTRDKGKTTHKTRPGKEKRSQTGKQTDRRIDITSARKRTQAKEKHQK